jgi:hypothetical protein
MMMSEPKPFASLSSGLLARKGGAKPAMKPQAFGQLGASLDDLGWNDMGHDPYEAPPHTPSIGLTPAPRGPVEPIHEVLNVPALDSVPEPEVVEQQRKLEAHFAPAPVKAEAAQPELEPAKPEAPKAAPRRKSKPAPAPAEARAKAKAAFTLRLDAERHLKLRLACALTRSSAQALVTAALDQYLESQPEIEAMVRRMPSRADKKRA